MESIVNYESDDGNVKITNKTSAKDSSKSKEKRRHSSDDDSSDASSSSHDRDRIRKRLNEDDRSNRKSPSPRKSSHKSSRSDKYKSHDSRSDRHRQRSSSRDSDRYERKKRRNDDRDDRKRHRQRSKEREQRNERSESRDREDYSRSKDRHRDKSRDRSRDRSSERRRERYDDRKRHNRRESERRYDDDRDIGRRREEPPHRSGSRNANDSRSNSSSSNSSSAIRRAEALNRTIERRANEKVQQLQKLGIEIPALMQQQHIKALNQQAAQIHPISTSIASGGLLPSASNENANGEPDNLTLNLSNFTSPVLTNAKYTEQMQKKKLIWGAKKTTPTETVTTNNKWEAAKFSQDSDGKMASKFLRLMGMKNAPATAASDDTDASVEKREQMFSSMEQQYEIARQATHTMRGVGLGFGSQSRPC